MNARQSSASPKPEIGDTSPETRLPCLVRALSNPPCTKSASILKIKFEVMQPSAESVDSTYERGQQLRVMVPRHGQGRAKDADGSKNNGRGRRFARKK